MTVQKDINYGGMKRDYKDSVKKKNFTTHQTFDIKRLGKEKENLGQWPGHTLNHCFLRGKMCLKGDCRTEQADLGSSTVLGQSRSCLRSHWIRDL